MTNIQSTFAFIFDSGKLGSSFYGEVVFEQMIKGGELSENPVAITVSLGDIFTYQRYIDIEPYIFKDEYCTLDFDDLLSEQIFIPLDATDNKAITYAPFQTMAQYYISLGYSGIIYGSTVCSVGKNIVLFDKQMAHPIGAIEDFRIS